MASIQRTNGGTVLVEADSVNKSLAVLAGALHSWMGTKTPMGVEPIREITRRGELVREFAGPVTVEITDPRKRHTFLRGRDANPWTGLAEFPWILTGRNDVEWLLPYLPSAAEFSDDGTTWRGAYGPRLRRWGAGPGNPGFDQLNSVVRKLSRSPDTRQVVVSIWDPELDFRPRFDRNPGAGWVVEPEEIVYKDYPCTNMMYFSARPGREPGKLALDMTVVMRSNDLMWGYSAVNAHNFTLLQELVAYCCGFEVGFYRHEANNLHVYERHFNKLSPLTGAADPYMLLPEPEPVTWGTAPDPEERLGVATEQCAAAMQYVQTVRGRDALPPSLGDVWLEINARCAAEVPAESYVVQWAYFMLLHHFAMLPAEQSADFEWASWLSRVQRPDWRMAAVNYLSRRHPGDWRWVMEKLAPEAPAGYGDTFLASLANAVLETPNARR